MIRCECGAQIASVGEACAVALHEIGTICEEGLAGDVVGNCFFALSCFAQGGGQHRICGDVRRLHSEHTFEKRDCLGTMPGELDLCCSLESRQVPGAAGERAVERVEGALGVGNCCEGDAL